MQILKADTAVKVRIGPFVDVGDGFTPETGVTLSGADEAELLKHNGAATVDISSNTWTAITGCDGWYDLSLTAGNLDTEGLLEVVVQDDSVCLPVHARFMVVNANAYDALYGAAGTDKLQVDVTELGGASQSAIDLKDFADDGYDPSTNKVEGVKLVDTTTVNTDMTGTDNAALASVCTEARLAELDAANIPTDLSNIETDTQDIQSRLPAGLVGGKMDSDAVAISGSTVAADNVEANIGNLDAAVSGRAVAGDAMDLTAGAVDDIWDEVLTAATHNVATSAGRRLRDISGTLVLHEGTAQAGASGSITLATEASSLDDFYNHAIVIISDGTGAGQARAISDYTGSTRVANVVPNWTTAPDATSVYDILADTEKHVYELHSNAIDSGSFATDAIDAGALAADAVSEIQSGLALASVCTEARLSELDAANIPSDVDGIVTTLGTPANIDTGGATIADNLKKLADDNSGGDFDATNHSLKAIRDRGDAAWITGGGGSISEILRINYSIPTSIDLANTTAVRLGIILGNAVDDLPSTAEITPGTISIERKAIGGTSWSAVVTDAAMSEANGFIYYDEVFDSGSGYAEGDSIQITFKSQKITVAANDYEIHDASGVIFQTFIRETMRGTDSANTTVPDAAGTAAALHAITDGKIDNVETDTQDIQTKIGTPANIDSGGASLANNLKKLADDNGGVDFDAGTDSLQAIRDRGDAAWVTGGGGAAPTVEEIVAGLMADTGFTAGGTMTYEKLLKILAAWAAGKWKTKAGESSVYQLLDADDGNTVIMEFDLSTTSPQKVVTII